MAEFHSAAELLSQPSKLAFGKRVSENSKPQVEKRKRSRSTSSAITPDVDQLQGVTPGPCARDTFPPHHVRTRRITSHPVRRVLLKARRQTCQGDPVQPRPCFSILSLAFPEPHIDYPTTTHASPHDSGVAEQQHNVPRLHRKEPPQLTVRDAIAEQLVKLRLPATTHTPLAPTGATAPRSTINFSFPFQHSNSAKAAKSAWNRMASSNPLLPSFRGQLNPPDTSAMDLDFWRRHGENSTDPIVINDHGDDECDLRSISSLESLESAGLSRQLINRRRTRPILMDQSPSGSCISITTADSFENSESQVSALISDCIDDARHDRKAWEEKDHRLAQLLQEKMRLTPAQLAEKSGSPAALAESPEIVRLETLRQAITHVCTRNYTNMDFNTEEGTHLRRRDCVVCDDSIAIGDLPSLTDCEHRPETCAGCYADWITTQLQGSTWREAKCPGSDCDVVLSYHDIRLYASSETFEKYDTFKARALINEDPDFRWCPASGCNSGQIHTTGVAGNIFTCSGCGSKTCVVHENTWHEGESCADFDNRISGRKQREQKAQEEASLKKIKELTRKCPGPGCDWNIQKNDGCDHMTCTKCGYEFCWICLCDYKKVLRTSNAAHARSCSHWRL